MTIKEGIKRILLWLKKISDKIDGSGSNGGNNKNKFVLFNTFAYKEVKISVDDINIIDNPNYYSIRIPSEIIKEYKDLYNFSISRYGVLYKSDHINFNNNESTFKLYVRGSGGYLIRLYGAYIDYDNIDLENAFYMDGIKKDFKDNIQDIYAYFYSMPLQLYIKK